MPEENNAIEGNASETASSVSQPPEIFSNHQVDTQHITTTSLDMLPLSPKYRIINLGVSAFWGGLLLIVTFVLSSGWFFEMTENSTNTAYSAYAIVGVITLWTLGYHWFADPLKKYALREHDINFQSGLLFHKLVSQPLLRIQHIEIKRGPIERKAGLATLQVFSAGGASHTFYIPGLEHERAIQLRQYILDHKDLAADV